MAHGLGIFSGDKGSTLKERINFAIKQIDIQRRELEHLRIRLEERRVSIFNATVIAIEKSDEIKAKVLSCEHVELQKITRMVSASELALLHITVRLETLRDVGEVMYVLSNAFKAVKRIGKSVAEVAPNLEIMANEINNSFSGILSELGVLSPNVRVSLTDTPQKIFEKAQELIQERASQLEIPKTMKANEEAEDPLLERTKRIALLATEDDSEDASDESEFRPVLLSETNANRSRAESALKQYLEESGSEKFNLAECSASLNLPVDLVEQAYIKLLSEGRFGGTLSNKTGNQVG